MNYTPTQLGQLIRITRKGLGVTQEQLAMTAGTGLRFIIDLEKGKPTCHLGKALSVMSTLGIDMTLTAPTAGVRNRQLGEGRGETK